MGPIVFISTSLLLWISYTICVISQTALTSKSLQNFRNEESNTTLQQLPKSSATFVVTWTEEVVVLFLTPGYLVSFFYLLFTGSYVLDMFSRNKIRMQFITTTCTSISSIMFLLSAGSALFVNIFFLSALYAVTYLINDMIKSIQEAEEMSGQSIPEKDELKSSSDQIAYAKSWFGIQLVFLFLMLLFCCFYLCYWPHVLRRRKPSNHKFVSNIEPEDSNDDL